MKNKKVKVPKATTGKGWVGTWLTGEMGWCMPDHIHASSTGSPNSKGVEDGYLNDERLFLCEIIIKPITNVNGRPITKIIKK